MAPLIPRAMPDAIVRHPPHDGEKRCPGRGFPQDGRVRLGTWLAIIVVSLAGCRGRALPEPIDLTLPEALSGAPYAFAAHRGEVQVVYFFATWCIPCQAMEPFMEQVAREGAAEGIRVVGIALDREGRRTVAPYVSATRPSYPVLLGGPGIAAGRSPFGKIPELPATLFLDRSGRPASSISGVTDSRALLARAREVRGR